VHLVGREIICEFLEGRLGELGLLPELRGKVAVEGLERGEGGLGEVAHSCGSTRGRRKAVGNTSVLNDLLRGGGSNDAGTTRGGHETDVHGATLAVDLVGHSVGETDLATPVTAAHGDDLHLRGEHAAANGVGHLLARLNTKADMPIKVADEHEGLEAGSLTSSRLLLHRLDLQNLVLELAGTSSAEEKVNNLPLLHGHGEEVNVLDCLDLAGLHETTDFGAWHPLLLAAIGTAATSATAATAATISTATTISTISTAAAAVAATAPVSAEATSEPSPVSHFR
jgi:hypothetical protein